ncbi:MAG: ferrochelatase [Alphaproteobacteria bacterium]|nr:ferrochelatase [Alphaproteobacteria bacterium]
MTRAAVVLFNLGGPDRPEAVRAFLHNLFSDPAILRVPAWVRPWLARIITARRAPTAARIYAEIGGRSPILEQTTAQARALEIAVENGSWQVKAFIAMRYWHPMSEATVLAVRDYDPERIILLPLYPQYSTTTTASSLAEWARVATRHGLRVPTTAVCCYPDDAGFIAAQVRLLQATLNRLDDRDRARARVLFSAHGLPKRIIAEGDPYAWQIERTANAIATTAGLTPGSAVVCYQSRVGPLEWLGPSTEAEIARAGGDRVPLVVLPIAFVSEHSETLVELDRTYAARAAACGVPCYLRVPTVTTEPEFIGGLAHLVRDRLHHWPAAAVTSGVGTRLCPAECRDCGLAA